jgi:hypothetical protein
MKIMTGHIRYILYIRHIHLSIKINGLKQKDNLLIFMNKIILDKKYNRSY